MTQPIATNGSVPGNEQLPYSAIFDAIPSHVCVLDRKGVVIAVNAPWRNFAEENDGVEEGVSVGVNYLDVCDRGAEVEAEGAAEVAQGIRSVLGGEQREFFNRYPCHSPEAKRWFQVRVRACDGDGPARAIVAHESISETQEIERLTRKYQSDLAHVVRVGTLNEMAIGIAHELNQPLASISNYAAGCRRIIESQLETNPSAARLMEAFEAINSEAHRAGEIIKRVRRFVQKGNPVSVCVDMREVVEEAVALTRAEAERAQIQLVVRAADDPLCAQVDPVQIQQVLVNLIRNAIEAIRDAPKPLDQRRVTVFTAFDVPASVRVTVRDSGPGVPSQDLAKIFDPFYSTKPKPQTETAGGMGLGLSLCRSIIDAHGGDLWAIENRMGGLNVAFSLPLVVSDDADEESTTR